MVASRGGDRADAGVTVELDKREISPAVGDRGASLRGDRTAPSLIQQPSGQRSDPKGIGTGERPVPALERVPEGLPGRLSLPIALVILCAFILALIAV